ncbi:hypothetical protein SERLA73DRAFT_17537, partial [Serpula lacrymans var. lacrymans S7.3]
VITRWTAHYLAFQYLLDLRLTLQHVFASNAQQIPAQQLIKTGDWKAIQKAETMNELVNDSLFWHTAAR